MSAKEKSLTGIPFGPCFECGRPVYVTGVSHSPAANLFLVHGMCEGDGQLAHGVITPATIQQLDRVES